MSFKSSGVETVWPDILATGAAASAVVKALNRYGFLAALEAGKSVL